MSDKSKINMPFDINAAKAGRTSEGTKSLPGDAFSTTGASLLMLC
jgi:hypothetical protein